MDLDRLKEILDWMERSSVAELQISDGDFEVHLKKAEGAVGAPPIAAVVPERPAGHEVVSTSFGVIHLRPAPDSPPFVTLGQTVVVGQSLCTIEAMKVFSPIEAERAGKIAAILIEDGAEVGAGHALFRIE
ncbi:MAG: acetyl-CoA carboxylase biotin carboxyl carrier protein subunit [Devosia sp.]|nr:acetyl-CoA carboxylase biotin carboxyl carrier protein subunit [Devosia sp.]